jgi:hypothetical protein
MDSGTALMSGTDKLIDIMLKTSYLAESVGDSLSNVLNAPGSPLEYRLHDIDHGVSLARQSQIKSLIDDWDVAGLASDTIQLTFLQQRQTAADQAFQRYLDLRLAHSPYAEAAWRNYVVTRLKTVPGLGDGVAVIYSVFRPRVAAGYEGDTSGMRAQGGMGGRPPSQGK